jgi:flagellar motor switch protein FliN/FliY
MNSETSDNGPADRLFGAPNEQPIAGTPAGDEETAASSREARAEAEFAVAHDLSPAPISTPTTCGREPDVRATPDYLLDVRLTLSVEVGRVQMPVREVMELGPGSIVELQRAAGEPVEIYANGRCIGHGEIVVVGDQFGVRIGELGGAPDR